MSIYSGDVNTRILEPVSHSNRRSEFRLIDDEVYLSNIRLINVGADTPAKQGGNGAIGLPSIINSIHLYSGNQLLDQVTDFGMWECFKGVNHENSVQASIRRENDGSLFGFEAQGDSTWDAVDEGPNRQGIKQTSVNIDGYMGFDSSIPSNTAWVSLKEVFGFLKSSMVVPTNILRNLRLVINYNTLAQLNQVASDNSNTSVEILRPLLVVDEMNESPERSASMSSYRGVTYQSVENDRVRESEVVGPVDGKIGYEQTYLLNGFNQKYVDKFVVALQPQTPSTWISQVDAGLNNELVASLGSIACADARFQFRVNGSNKFTGCALEGKMKRLGYVVDYCGDMNIPVGGNYTEITNTNISQSADFVGHLDYTACPIQEYVNEFKLTFGRSGVGQTGNIKANQPILINCFGLVRKNLVVNSDGSFIITY